APPFTAKDGCSSDNTQMRIGTPLALSAVKNNRSAMNEAVFASFNWARRYGTYNNESYSNWRPQLEVGGNMNQHRKLLTNRIIKLIFLVVVLFIAAAYWVRGGKEGDFKVEAHPGWARRYNSKCTLCHWTVSVDVAIKDF